MRTNTVHRARVVAALPEGVDVNETLHQAARDNNYNLVRQCLEARADATLYKDGYTPIGIAIFSGHVGVIEEFRAFFDQRVRPGQLAKLLDQPQGVRTFFGITLPFLCPKFSNSRDMIESPVRYPEGSAHRASALSLFSEAYPIAGVDSRAADAIRRMRRNPGNPINFAALREARQARLREENPRPPADPSTVLNGACGDPVVIPSAIDDRNNAPHR